MDFKYFTVFLNKHIEKDAKTEIVIPTNLLDFWKEEV